MDETQLNLKGKSGTTYTFFPRVNLSEDTVSKGAGIYVFVKGEKTIIDIQFLADDEEIVSTMKRMQEDSAQYFYFKDEADELQSDADIDDMKGGEDYREDVE